MKYRSKPSEVEAVQWTGGNLNEVMAFAGSAVRKEYSGDGVWGLQLHTGKSGAQGWVPVPLGTWIVRNQPDWPLLWPVDPDYFAKRYEPA